MNDNGPPPDETVIPLELPTQAAMHRLDDIARDHPDEAVRLLASIVSRLSQVVEALGAGLTALSHGETVIFELPNADGGRTENGR